MTPQELKASILQLAIQGKLVEQRPEEGTGGELLERIFAAKNAKDAKGAKKSSRAEAPRRGEKADAALSCEEIPDSEKPFDIPESWVWVRLGEVVFNHGQKKPVGDFSYIDIGSIDNKNQKLSNDETIVHAENASPRARKIVQKGDVIYATVRPYLHNVCVIDREFSREPIASTGFAVMACADCLENKYLFYFLLSPDFDRYANSSENAKGVAYPAISDKRLYDALMPLPPLAEQKRIVAKIEELLPYIDRYEKAWSKLEDFNKRFPSDMQKSLLQMAIQGKLVDQQPEEGTGEELYRQIQSEKQRLIKSGKIKKEKPLPEITSDEIPFDIPESSKWVRLGEICKSIADGDHQPPPQVPSGIPFLVISNVSKGTLDFSNTRFVPMAYFNSLSGERIPGRGDILFTVTGSYGIPLKIDIDRSFCFQRHMALLKLLTNREYLFYALMSPVVQKQCDNAATGTAQKTVGLNALRNLLIPLPPLAEQKRIVAKLEELLPLCERLK